MPGYGPQDGQGRLINVYGWSEAGTKRWRPVPGLTVFANTTRSGPRGFIDVNGTLYGAYEDKAITVSGSGAVAQITGALAGEAPVTWARNNRTDGPDVVCVTEFGAFVITPTSITTFADPDLPQPQDIAFLDGYFLFTIGDARIFASDLNSLSVNSLSFTKAEAAPDGLLRGVVKDGLYYAFGPSSIEIYQNAATLPFPLARSGVMSIGLLSKWCLAGYEPGWEYPLHFVAADCTVRRLAGNQSERISFAYLERLIEAVPDKAQIIASVYGFGGQAVFSISSPYWTWEFNTVTDSWHERRSLNSPRWRARQTVWWRGHWYAGDFASTNLLQISETARTEAGDPFESVIESAVAAAFPNKARVQKMDFLFNPGVGQAGGTNPTQTDPRVVVSWSDDGGAIYGKPLHKKLGKQGHYLQQVSVQPAGTASRYGRRVRVSWSDAVDVTFRGGDMVAAELGK